MAKRGRPRLDRPKHDYGTPELVLKRITMAPKDATMSTCPLDVMLSKGLISPEAHGACSHFLAIRKMIFGRASPGAVDLLAVSGGRPDELNEEDAAKIERKYRHACAAVKRFGEKTMAATEDVLVHQRWPEWIQFRNSSHWERRLVLLGVAALLGWHEEDRRNPA